MTYIEAYQLLEEKGQSHVLRFYDSLSAPEQAHLLSQIESIDWRVIDSLSHKDEPVNKGHIEPLAAIEVSEIEEKREHFRQLGLDAIRSQKVGLVLLAGGQGTRLGLDKPKGMLNVGITRELYLFEMLIRNLQKNTDAAGVPVPFYIMTSDKNNADTVAFFEEHNYFGYPKDYISFFIQEMVPCTDFDGKLLMESPSSICMSPNGNGGWYTSMYNCGILEDVRRRGLEWINVFSVDNVLQQIADPLFIGATLDSGCVSGAKVVRKAAPNEGVGVLCLEDGRPSIVEYYEMTDEMANSREENGELTYNFGVILNYLFRVDVLETMLQADMPLHIATKKIPHIDENGDFIKPETPNGYKFETLALDMVHMSRDCIPYEIVREKEFAPIKNATGVDSLESARELMKKNGIKL